MEFNNSLDQKELITVPVETRSHLEKTSSFAKILSVIGMVFSGFGVLGGLGLLFGGASMASYISGVFGIFGFFSGSLFLFFGLFILVFCAVAIFLLLKLYKFSVLVSSSLMNENDFELEAGLKELQVYFKASGIVTIVTVVIAIVTVFAIGGMFFSSFMK